MRIRPKIIASRQRVLGREGFWIPRMDVEALFHGAFPDTLTRSATSKWIILARHGDFRWEERKDMGLTPRGRLQGRALGEFIRYRSYAPEVLFVSPAPRAVETGRVVHHVLGASCQKKGSIAEFMERDHSEEPLADHFDGTFRWLSEVRYRIIMIVAHGNIINDFTSAALKVPARKRYAVASQNLPHHTGYAVVELRFGRGPNALWLWNSVAHVHQQELLSS